MILCTACEKAEAKTGGLCYDCYNAIYHAGNDLENKNFWVKKGVAKEWEFVHSICPQLGLKAQWNVEDPYMPDLWVNNRLAELKYKSTPFFRSFDMFNIPPQYCMAINGKDYMRYKELYPNLDIYFWVDWQELTKKIGKKIYSVRPMFAVYVTSFKKLARGIEDGSIPYHSLRGRAEDKKGNAKGVYLFSAKTLDCLVERML